MAYLELLQIKEQIYLTQKKKALTKDHNTN